MSPEWSSPAYQHVPLVGLAFAELALIAALVVRNRVAQCIALALVLIASGSVAAVNWTGHQAYKQVRALTDDAGSDWLDEHFDRGDKAAPVFYVLAALAVAAFLAPQRWPRSGAQLGWLVALVTIACIAAAAWVAKAGGQVRHGEFRSGPPPMSGQ
jgi:hypothetical protein